MAKIFSLFGEIFVENEKANKAIKDTTGEASKAEGGLSKVIGTAGKVGAAVVTGTAAAVTGLVALTTKTAAAGDRIDKMSQSLGLSRQGFQEWDYIMSQNGASIDSMGTAMKTMTNLMVDGGKNAESAFGKLGLTLEDVQGLSQEDTFGLLVERLQGMEDGAEKDALALDLFGRQAQALSPLLNQTAESTEALRQRAHDLGMVMTDEAVDGSVVLGDTLDDLKGAAAGLMNGLGASLMPVVQQFVDIIIQNMPIIQEMMDKLGPVMVGFFEQALPFLLQLVEQLLPIIFQILEAVFPILEQILPVLLTLAEAILPPLVDLLNMLLPPLMDLLNAILPPLTAVIEVLAAVFKEVLGAAIEGIQPIIEGLTTALRGIMNFITGVFSGNWKQAWEGIKTTFSGIWESLVGCVKLPINFIIDLLNKAIQGFNKIKIPDWVPLVGGKGINIPEIPRLAKGLDYVPHDNYMALLHKGERVLTKDETEKDSSGGVIINMSGPVSIRSDDDIRRVAEELDRLRRRGLAAQGV